MRALPNHCGVRPQVVHEYVVRVIRVLWGRTPQPASDMQAWKSRRDRAGDVPKGLCPQKQASRKKAVLQSPMWPGGSLNQEAR